MERNSAQRNLSAQDVKAICDAAEKAWEKADDSTREVSFTWKNKKYKSRLTAISMLVDTSAGTPVAARYL